MKPFTWSWSRHRALEGCRRRYWYDYYGARDGWRASAPERTRTLYEMKRLAGPNQWVGQVVHELAARVIGQWQQGVDVDRDALLEDAARVGRRAIDDARRGLSHLDPRRYTGFAALYYDEVPEPGWWDALVDDLVGQVAAWLDHPIAARIREVPERVREVERLERFVVGDTPLFVALDVLVDDGQGGLVVIDWKTGTMHVDDEVDAQLGVYALYAHRRYTMPGPRITVVQASTRDGSFRQRTGSAADLAETSRRIQASADQMAALLRDPTRDEAEEVRFPKLPAGSDTCETCTYRRACDREAVRI
ncbi:MAG: PD-(D/E)XK nuclease family protein [Alphaproteobacteria bacterium]|nr:PD-(D/E)XK nuclease family protein [Alphaproteobacteria bacterium]